MRRGCDIPGLTDEDVGPVRGRDVTPRPTDSTGEFVNLSDEVEEFMQT